MYYHVNGDAKHEHPQNGFRIVWGVRISTRVKMKQLGEVPTASAAGAQRSTLESRVLIDICSILYMTMCNNIKT